MKHLSTLALHQLRYNELDGDELDAARAHLASCEQCAQRLAHQERERAAFVAAPVPEPVRRAATRRSPRRLGQWIGPLIAVAAIAVLWVALPAADDAQGPVVDRVATRGTEVPALEVFVDDGTGVRPWESPEALAEGTRVQLSFATGGAAHAAVAGRDASGEIEVYQSFPVPEATTRMDAPFGLLLDDAPGTQEFFVILGDAPLDSATVEEMVRAPVAPPPMRRLRVAVPKASPLQDLALP